MDKRPIGTLRESLEDAKMQRDVQCEQVGGSSASDYSFYIESKIRALQREIHMLEELHKTLSVLPENMRAALTPAVVCFIQRGDR